MNTITCELNDSQRRQLLEAWREFKVDKVIPYVEFQCKVEQCTITAYTSGKVVFQGNDAALYASTYTKKQPDAIYTENDTSYPNDITHSGSDEVGTGDYFGPVCVCACTVKKEDIAWLKELKVNDSKQINDAVILKIAPQIMKHIAHSKLILDNTRYNKVQQSNNLNAIKAKLHNQAYLNLLKKEGTLPDLCVIDQFTPETTYFRYLKEETQVYRKLHFETKAESKYLAVACASIIARYTFLISWKNIEEHYNMKLAKGAGKEVNQDALRFVKEFGIDELKNIAKMHFKNTELLVETLNVDSSL